MIDTDRPAVACPPRARRLTGLAAGVALLAAACGDEPEPDRPPAEPAAREQTAIDTLPDDPLPPPVMPMPSDAQPPP